MTSLKSLLLASTLGLATLTPASLAMNPISDAVAAQDRGEDDTQWDARRRPAEVLAFLGVKPGMTVWDQGAGRGYYTAILSHIVGPEGKVYAHNSNGFWPRIKDEAAPRFKALGNVVSYVGDQPEFKGHDGEFDLIMIGLLYHHMHFRTESGEAAPDGSKAYYARALKLLKPGGTFAIIEHQAPDGTPRAESAAWHRASLRNAIDDLTAAGFEYVGSSDALANPDDPQTVHFRDLPTGRYSSQRFIAKFRKPE